VRRRVPAGVSVAVVVPVLAADLAPDPAGGGGPAGPERLRRAVQELVDADPLVTEVLVVGAPDVPREPLEEAAAAVRTTGRTAVALTAPAGRGRGALRNWGAAVTDAEYLAFLDPAVTPTGGWLTELVGLCTDREVGAAGARLVAVGDVLEQAGYGLVGGTPKDLLRGLPATTTAYAAAALVPGERSAVSGACLAVRKDVFTYVGGFSGRFENRYEDVDLCLKLRGLNRRVVYTPFATGVTRDRPRPHTEDAVDLERLRERWWPQLHDDPYINPAIRSADWLSTPA
jgi:GT2 family glycosyltransferase